MKVFRVQDKHGEGPWKPGVPSLWCDERTEQEMERIPPALIEMPEALMKARSGTYLACGCRSLDQLKLWFTPSEYAKLSRMGYKCVSLKADRVLGESDVQCIFERKSRLNVGASPVCLYEIDHPHGERKERGG